MAERSDCECDCKLAETRISVIARFQMHHNTLLTNCSMDISSPYTNDRRLLVKELHWDGCEYWSGASAQVASLYKLRQQCAWVSPTQDQVKFNYVSLKYGKQWTLSSAHWNYREGDEREVNVKSRMKERGRREERKNGKQTLQMNSNSNWKC